MPADLPAATDVYRSASLFNAGDRDNLLADPEHLILGPEGLAEGCTHVAEEDGSLIGFATWIDAGGTIELEDLFVHPGWMRRGIATRQPHCGRSASTGRRAPGSDRQPAHTGLL